MSDEQASVVLLRLENFRGVLGPLEVLLQPPGKNGCALLLYGDNGTGKSSICDALEFVTRGVVSRRSSDGLKRRREVKNFSTDSAPAVDIHLNDGSVYRRGNHSPNWAATGQTVEVLGRASHIEGFEISPLVVRRDAVESFWRIPEENRLDFFWDYIKRPSQEYRTRKDEEAIAQHDSARTELAQVQKRFEKVLPRREWPPLFSFPTHAARSELALRKMAQQINLKTAGARTLTSAQQGVIKGYTKILKREESLRHDAESARRKDVRDTEQLRSVLEAIAPSVVTDFRVISQEDWITGIRFDVTDDGRMQIQLQRSSGRPLSPDEVLSEATLDLLALLVLIELHIACADRGQRKIIALDDVFQSVDTTLRSRALEHLAGRFNGWQIILTLHDRLWLEIANRKFKQRDFFTSILELRGGGYGKTPTSLVSSTGPLRDLEHALAAGSSGVVLAGIAGRTLEALAEQLSFRLEISVKRKEGDRYELNDLWPPVMKKLESSFDPNILALASRMQATQFLRNRLGAHYADWGEGLSDNEAADSARDVVALWSKFLCPKCGRFGQVRRTGAQWSLKFGCCGGGPSQPVMGSNKS